MKLDSERNLLIEAAEKVKKLPPSEIRAEKEHQLGKALDLLIKADVKISKRESPEKLIDRFHTLIAQVLHEDYPQT